MPYEQDVVSRVPKSGFEVVQNAATGAHAASGQNNHGARLVHQIQVMLIIPHRVEIFEIQRVVACGVQGFGFLVPEWGQGVVEAGQFQAEGGIDIDRDVQFCGDVQPIHFIDQLLGATQGKGGNEHLAVVGQAVGEDFAEPFGSVGAVAVKTVAVGGFQHQQVAGFGDVGITQDRGISASEVA